MFLEEKLVMFDHLGSGEKRRKGTTHKTNWCRGIRSLSIYKTCEYCCCFVLYELFLEMLIYNNFKHIFDKKFTKNTSGD